jgi:hypothetical protein
LASQLAARFGTILARLQGSAHAGELVDENHNRCGAINREYEDRFLRQLVATIRTERRAGRLTRPATPAPELARYLVAAARGIKAAMPQPPLDVFPRDLEGMVKLLVPDED